MKTQAWGWLIAGVLAAGLNASYHDGGLRWMDQAAAQVARNSAAVLALATGRAEGFLAAAQVVTAHDETASCRLAAALARVQARVARSEAGFDRFEAMSAREEARLARIEANRARIEAQVARFHISAAAFRPAMVSASRISLCPRMKLNLPQPPTIKMPAMPIIHVEAPNLGPV